MTVAHTKPVAVVTGANRGIGYAVAQGLAAAGYTVVACARNETKGRTAVAALVAEGHDAVFEPLDVRDTAAAKGLVDRVLARFGRIDALVNNAGILPDDHNRARAADTDPALLLTAFDTNTVGPFRLIQAVLPAMRRAGHGRIVNVSSGMGQLSEMNGGYPAYRLSKTALNALTRIFSEETRGADILVNSVCPGWVRTDMGGAEAERSPAEGADTIVWLATLPAGGPTGGFFRDRRPIAW